MKGRKTKTFRRRRSLRRRSSKKTARRLRGGKMETSKSRDLELIKLEPNERITANETLLDDMIEPPSREQFVVNDVINRERELEGMRQRLNVPISNEEIEEIFRGYQLPQHHQSVQEPEEEDLGQDDYEMYDFVDVSGGKTRRRKMKNKK